MRIAIIKVIKLTSLLIPLILSGCAIDSKSTSRGTYFATSTSRGELLVELNSDPEYPKPTMREICKLYGGLDESSIYKVNGGWLDIGYTRWSYACNGVKSNSQQGASPQSPKITIDSAKSSCKDLGFKTGTEGFGKCVLQLSR